MIITPDRVIWNGDPGTVWTNTTDRTKYQFVCSLQNTCGFCLQYHMAIGYVWGIPLHWGCRCEQRAIKPGSQAPHAFVDFREVLDNMPHDQQVKAVGASNFKLLKKGIVDWKDVVTPSRVRPLREVVAIKRLSVKTLEGAGVNPRIAAEAHATVNTPAHILAEQHRAELLKKLDVAGVDLKTAVDSISKGLASKVTITAGPDSYGNGPAWSPKPVAPLPLGDAAHVATLVAAMNRKIPTPPLPPRSPAPPTPPEAGSVGTIGESLPGPMFKTAPPEELPARSPAGPTPPEAGSTGPAGESLPGPMFKLKKKPGPAPGTKFKTKPGPKPKGTPATPPAPSAPATPPPTPPPAKAAPTPKATTAPATKAAAKAAVASFPKYPDAMKTVKTLGGSTGAKLVEDSAGKQYVLKKGANPGHLREEAAADDLYRSMGLAVPASKIYEHAGAPMKLSEFHEGTTLGALKAGDPAAYEKARAELKKGFVADALMGNWDVIGASGDNVLVTKSGQVLRIDNGGSLRYRAQGGLKSSSQWSGQVGELESLRSKTINPHAAGVYHDITTKEIKDQIKAIVGKQAAILKAAPADVRDVLKQRLDYLKDYAKTADKPAKPIKVGNWKATPADKFKSVSHELRDWGEKHYKSWREGLSPDESKAVKVYTGAGYRPLNKFLRGQTKDAPTEASIVPHLDKALAAKPVPEDIVVYRGLDMSGIYKAMGLNGRTDLRPGMDLSDKGYTSTSPDKGKAWAGEKWEIRVPKGTPGAWVDPISTHKGEKEFLLGRDVDTYRIVEVHPDRIVVEAHRSEDLLKQRRSRKK